MDIKVTPSHVSEMNALSPQVPQGTTPPQAPREATPTVSPGEFIESSSTENVHALAEVLITNGSYTREAMNARLKQDGFPELAAPVQMTPQQAEIEEAFPSAKTAADFNMPSVTPHGVPYEPQHYAEDLQNRQYLLAGEFPRELGSALAQEASNATNELAGMDPVEVKAWGFKQRESLQRIWGSDLDKNIKIAHDFIAEIDAKQKGAMARFQSSCSALVIKMAYDQAVRLKAKRGL